MKADKLAFLVDADAYFRAFVAAVDRARRSLMILGWDIDSRTRLLPGPHPRNLPVELGPFLNAIVSHRPALRAYLLGWDFSMIFALERELLPTYRLGWLTHPRVKFWLDDRHPLGGAHHQKIVTIDDRVAFAGGLDLTIRRWDTAEHRAYHPLRVDPGGQPYPPFHDAQILVQGEAAAALAELARERWRRATGEVLRPCPPDAWDPWPSQVVPDLENVPIAIARTEPVYDGFGPVSEVRQLYLDSIAAARRYIYMENQYFTSQRIAHALAARLAERDGPEILIVLPLGNNGWVEENTFGLLREQILRELRQSDRFGRLRIYYAALPNAGDYVQIHSKVMIVDDLFLRLGSANLSNRSMGLDTECDIAIEAGEERVRATISRFRDRLLAEHLDVAPEAVAQAAAEKRSLLAAVDTLRGRGRRSLEPLEKPLPAPGDLPEPLIVDPERPVEAGELIAELVPEDVRSTADYRLMRNVFVLLALLGVAAAWRWTPLAQWLDIDTVTAWSERIAAYPAAPLLTVGAFVLGGLVLFPVTLLVIGTALAFGPGISFLYALFGCVLSAIAMYGVGRLLGADVVQRFSGPRVQRLKDRLIRRGLVTMIAVRMVPVAPFSIVNMIAGALRIRFRDLVLGTVIGMTPGIFAITVFTDGLRNVIRRPTPESLALLVALALLIALAALGLRHWLNRPVPSARPVSRQKGE